MLVRCIDNVADFAKPVLDGLKILTGYNWVLLGGGPSPKDKGAVRSMQYVYLPVLYESELTVLQVSTQAKT